jgi:hypothetical protein
LHVLEADRPASPELAAPFGLRRHGAVPYPRPPRDEAQFLAFASAFELYRAQAPALEVTRKVARLKKRTPPVEDGANFLQLHADVICVAYTVAAMP